MTLNVKSEPLDGFPNYFNLPRRLRHLAELAYNLWWTWNSDASRVFRRLDPILWEACFHNPVQFLRDIEPKKLKSATQDRYYLEFYDEVIASFKNYMEGGSKTWYAREHTQHLNQPIAYFSTEFGLHETLPIYAGGLGVLSGDHLKEASDLGIPLVAIGFLYTQGYFKQRILEDGWQEAIYEPLSFTDLPVLPVLDQKGDSLLVSVDLPGRSVEARIWKVQVGRVILYLLDSNVDLNQAPDRELTARLYTNDLELRLSQEIILGIGGVRALRELGYNPAVWHLNEGHSAFLTLERIHEYVTGGMSFEDAQERIRASTIFTTHTPVPAGHDEFPLWMIDKYYNNYWPQLGLDREAFIELAKKDNPWGETFSMSILAMKMADTRNGVSELHGEVARKMWAYLFPGTKEEEVPIGHVTNGIHSPTWLARRLKHLFHHYFPADWMSRFDDQEVWESINDIPDVELWAVRRHLKRKLIAYTRERVRLQWQAGGFHPVQVIASGVLLDPYALTIGFARRFATYKRASLIFKDIPRLLDIIGHPDRPVQIIFAGKAHPADEPGKQLIQEVYRQVKRSDNAGRLVFLEDYDMNVARYLIQGVDVWLNNPRRPNEASGTSGQKAALNGVLNFSVLDGWWREGFNGQNGWAIGEETDYESEEEQDQADVESLYRTLEHEIIPLFYERSADELPAEWLGWMKDSIRTLAPTFSMTRMVKEYVNAMYLPVLPKQG